MRQSSLSLRAALAAALCVTSLGAGAQALDDRAVDPAVAHKQKAEIAKGDPARWSRGDTSYQDRLRLLKKEIAAAYKEAQNDCRKRPAAERAACLKDARATYQHDLANAPVLARQAPEAEVTEKVTIEPQVPPNLPPNR